MALQLLKRNYTMGGPEIPRILKLPQGEVRWSPRRLPVDVGDVMMSIRMDSGKNKYIQENISKYAQGINPYGEFGYPYKINKNNIRPPIIDPKFYQALSRMPVKFDTVTSGPIVSELYKKSAAIEKVAPRTIIDRVCPEANTTLSTTRSDNTTDKTFHEGAIALHLKQPRPSIPYWPTMPYLGQPGVPEIELDAKIIARPNMGIHAPFTHSDQSRDILNMRTPQHVAVSPGYKDPYTSVFVNPQDVTGIHENLTNFSTQTNMAAPIPTFDNLTRDGYDFAPKVQTSAWYNPSYYLTELSGYSIGNVPENCLSDKVQSSAAAPVSYRLINNGQNDTPIHTQTPLNVATRANLNSYLQEGELGRPELRDSLNYGGHFEGKAYIPTIDEHQTYNRAREQLPQQYRFIENRGQYGDALSRPTESNTEHFSRSGIRDRLKLQTPRVDKTGIEQGERIIPVGVGRFVHASF
jgi:hypothetical protein